MKSEIPFVTRREHPFVSRKAEQNGHSWVDAKLPTEVLLSASDGRASELDGGVRRDEPPAEAEPLATSQWTGFQPLAGGSGHSPQYVHPFWLNWLF